MTTTDHADGEACIRETYEVVADGTRQIAMIADPKNGHAWIRSDRVQPVVQ